MKSIRLLILITTALCLLCAGPLTAAKYGKTPNFLLITVDDMGWDTPGCFGGTVDDITPNIDRLAAEGMRFENGHVYVAVCQPSRQSMMTGRYNHRIGAPGFSPIDDDITTLQEALHKAGYINGILGKVNHLAPNHKYKWAYQRNRAQMGYGRDADQYYTDVSEFLKMAKKQERPFFLMANSHDPHRPFHGSAHEAYHFGDNLSKVKAPSRVYTADEVPIPGFLPELEQIREEMAQYYSSVKRADDTVGAILKALEDEGATDNTLIMFISDNGMPIATAKWNAYLHSTKTPWIVKWPGVIEGGTVDTDNFICGVDYTPTILDVIKAKAPKGMDGRSFLPLLKGKKQAERDHVFTAHYQWIHYYGNKEKRRNILEDMVNNKGWQYMDAYGGLIKNMPIRSIQNKEFGYIYNGWSNGKDEYLYGYNLTANALRMAAREDPDIAERLDFIRYRAPEEFYDLEKDPHGLNNLIDDPDYAETINEMRKAMLDWMVDCEDPVLEQFKKQTGAGA
jgi:N-sulfoglucosamine sulfohydrolase